MNHDWHERTACALGDAIGRGEIDPRALTEHFLTRIEAHDTDHLIYLRTTPDRARAEADAAAQRAANGLRASRLDGVPISWKDLYDTAGVATEGGTPLLAGRIPDRDAVVLQRATEAGTVCLGKTNTVQFALGGIGFNGATGTPPSAAMTDVPRAPGGSSSGAATSTARGLAAAGIGSDTGGSVRIPAAWNGWSVSRPPSAFCRPKAYCRFHRQLDTVGPSLQIGGGRGRTVHHHGGATGDRLGGRVIGRRGFPGMRKRRMGSGRRRSRARRACSDRSSGTGGRARRMGAGSRIR